MVLCSSQYDHLQHTPLFAGAKAHPRAVQNGPLRRESAAGTTSWVPGPRNAFSQKLRICAKWRRRSTEAVRGPLNSAKGKNERAAYNVYAVPASTAGCALRSGLTTPSSKKKNSRFADASSGVLKRLHVRYDRLRGQFKQFDLRPSREAIAAGAREAAVHELIYPLGWQIHGTRRVRSHGGRGPLPQVLHSML